MPAIKSLLQRYTVILTLILFTLFTMSLFSPFGHATKLDTKFLQEWVFAEMPTSQKQLDSDPKSTVLKLAETKFEQGLWEEAGSYAAQLIYMEPGNSKAHGILGTFYAINASKKMAQKELAFLKKAGDQSLFSDLINAILIAQTGEFILSEKHISSALEKEPNHPVAIYYAGSVSLAQDKLEEAEQFFKAVIEIKPDCAPALAGLGQVYLRQKRMDLAADYYQKAVNNQPEILLYQNQLIDIYKATGQQGAANRQMKTALYYVPGVREHYLRQGMQLLTLGSYRQAIENMDKIIGIYKRIPEAHYIKAAALANLKETKAAADNIQIFVSQQWTSSQAHHYAGMCYLALNQIDQAELQFTTAIRLNPDMGKSVIPLTVIEQIRKNYDRALEGLKLTRTGGEPPDFVDYLSAHMLLAKGDRPGYLNTMKGAAGLIPGLKPTTAFSVPSESKAVHFARDRNLMVIYFFNNWYGKVIELSETLLKLSPTDRYAWYYLALSKMAQNKDEEAIHAFNQLIKIEPELVAAYLSLGKLYAGSNNFKDAENAFNQAIKINPKYAAAYLARGDLFMQIKAESDAIADYRKAIEVDPTFPGSYYRLAMLYAEKPDKLDEALKLALKAEQLAPRNPVSLDVIGWVYVKRGAIHKGLEKLDAAYKQQPNDLLIQYHIGVAHYENNDLKAAQKALQAALGISKNFRGADHAREILQKISQ